MASGFARLQPEGVYARACQAYNDELSPRRSIPQAGGTVSPCLDRHFATASALFLHPEGVSSDARLEVPLPPNCQGPKTSSAIRWDGFLSRGSGMDSTGVTRQARLETRSTAGDPITFDLAYSACARGLTGSRGTGRAATMTGHCTELRWAGILAQLRHCYTKSGPKWTVNRFPLEKPTRP